MNRLVSIVLHVARIALGVTFFYSGWIKAQEPVDFARAVANYQVLPYSWNFLVAATLPYVELLAGTLLVLNRRVRPAALVLGILNFVFILALISVMARGLDIDCGCFDPSGQGHTTALEALLRDFGLMVLVILAWFSRKRGPARHYPE
ncbi:MAG: MauE/DoxX family redox-associated membrane protein [Thermodesulfobacteriota bacterium]|jgi:uncharacterized membrane protein YphA (DoxX/SURF4 family)|nr:MauE/DoxX family redox-associated membrane protein [Thermodesulfobacteriota bacterium]